MTGIRKAWRECGRVGGGGKQIVKGMGEEGNIGMLGQRQVTTSWEDNPVHRHNRCSWRGCHGRRGLPPVRKLDSRKVGKGRTRINT